ncbi:hypothetical protein ACIBM1_46490 [Streptomyces sp. NPDC050481]|uniref:hypothetical protein n=1 Tax=Streptomyces sp. NPDC050481 TaxID=3365616 RepID=UPI0037ACCF0A
MTTYDRPVLSAASSSTSGLTIPTQYRGNQLATMEATCVDGSNAGPVNWSPYQELNASFSLDYSGNGLLAGPRELIHGW